MIPLCLVTGFLGSGKTTFLRHIAARHAAEKIVYLVNDFSPQDVDGLLLEEIEDDVVSIPGGSIFCKCLVTQFLGHLRTIPERFGSDEAPIEGVVIEASGIADPMVVEHMLAETALDEVYELTTIVSIVDPGSLSKLVRTLPNIRAQIAAADVVLLNKTDLFGAEAVAQAERIVREINAGAPIVPTVRCAADVELFTVGRQHGLQGDYAPCVDPNYARFSVTFDRPVDIAALMRELNMFRDDLYRAKGFVPIQEGAAYIDLSAAGLTVEPVREAQTTGLAIIARGSASGEVQRLIDALRRAVVQS